MRSLAPSVLAALLLAAAAPGSAAEDDCPFAGRLSGEGRWRDLSAGLEMREIHLRFEDASIARMVGVRIDPGRFHVRLRWAARGGASGEQAPDVARETGAAVVVNAGYFDENARPLGFFLAGGKVYNRRILFRGRPDALHLGAMFFVREGSGTPGIASRESFEPDGIREAFQAGPHLVRGGLPAPGLERYREYWRPARRTVLALGRDGRLIVMVSEVDGRGLSWCELRSFLARPEAEGGLDAAEAMNLDGGSSSQLYVRSGGHQSHLVGRPVPAFVVIVPRGEGEGR